jgi:hypothetical protein
MHQSLTGVLNFHFRVMSPFDRGEPNGCEVQPRHGPSIIGRRGRRRLNRHGELWPKQKRQEIGMSARAPGLECTSLQSESTSAVTTNRLEKILKIGLSAYAVHLTGQIQPASMLLGTTGRARWPFGSMAPVQIKSNQIRLFSLSAAVRRWRGFGR